MLVSHVEAFGLFSLSVKAMLQNIMNSAILPVLNILLTEGNHDFSSLPKCVFQTLRLHS